MTVSPLVFGWVGLLVMALVSAWALATLGRPAEANADQVTCVFRLPSGQWLAQVVPNAGFCRRIADINGWQLLEIKPIDTEVRRG